ncbi:MAG: rhomboid family intramembrane serine protease [Halopseudomonas sp.]
MKILTSKLPWVTAATVAVALGFQLLPNTLAWLCFDQQAIVADGQWWRLLSGHLVHSSGSHFFWDSLAFAVFASLAERWNRRALLQALLLALVLLNMLLLSPWGLEQYCGLSGLMCAAAVQALWAHYQQQPGLIRLLPTLMGIWKLFEEAQGSSALIASDSWPLYAPAHWVGIGAGLVVLLIVWRRGMSDGINEQGCHIKTL